MITLETVDLILILTGAVLGGVVIGLVIGVEKDKNDLINTIKSQYKKEA